MSKSFGQVPSPDRRRTEEALKQYGYLGVERRRVPSVVSWRALACALGAIAALVVMVFSIYWTYSSR